MYSKYCFYAKRAKFRDEQKKHVLVYPGQKPENLPDAPGTRVAYWSMLFKTQLCFLQGISLQSKKSEKKKIINSPSSIVLYYWTSHLTCVTKKLNRKQTMKIPRRKELQQISCRLASSLAARFTCTSLVAKKKQTSKPAAKRSIGSLSTILARTDDARNDVLSAWSSGKCQKFEPAWFTTPRNLWFYLETSSEKKNRPHLFLSP